MPKLLHRLRNWWHTQSSSTFGVPFAISCVCGQKVTGRRQKAFQVVPCPTCGAEVFVLPLSPFPSVPGAEPARESLPATAPRFPRQWLAPVLTAAGRLVVLALVCWACIAFFPFAPSRTQSGSPPLKPEQAEQLALTHWNKAEEHISLAHFALALEQLEALEALQREYKSAWIEIKWLTHLRAEIGLYADLSDRSLEELLAEAVDLPEKEWEWQFQKRYQGKAIILADVVTRLPGGVVLHEYQIQANGQEGRIDFSNLPFFNTLPTEKPQQVLFGARLKDIHRVEPKLWTIQFASDSLVLLTNPQALAVSCPELDNAETRLLLAEQKQLMVK